jgi:hypothetical protein
MEQWEIDLRTQLEGTVATEEPRRPAPQRRRRQKTQRPSVLLPPKKKKKSNAGTLLIVAISLAGLLLLAVNVKNNESLFSWPKINEISLNKTDPKIDDPVAPTVDHSPAIAQLVTDVEELQIKSKTIEESMSKQACRTALLGILHNNNFVIVKNNYNRQDLVFFNRDWTIDAMPKYLNLSTEDEAYLRRYLRP